MALRSLAVLGMMWKVLYIDTIAYDRPMNFLLLNVEHNATMICLCVLHWRLWFSATENRTITIQLMFYYFI